MYTVFACLGLQQQKFPDRMELIYWQFANMRSNFLEGFLGVAWLFAYILLEVIMQMHTSYL